MSRRHFCCTDNAEVRAKIDEAKPLLQMPSLMRRLGYDEKHIGKTALCPFHPDEHPSFSVFQGKNGAWFHRCFAGCSSGDEIAFLVKHFGISRREAISRYLDMAGFPSSRPPKFREYPEFPKPHGSPGSHKSLVYPESPVSKGQALDKELEKELKDLAARNACTGRNTARERRFKFARDVRAIEKRIGRELTTDELLLAFAEWHRLSQPFLDDPDDDHLAMFLAELGKVRVPTGEGETIEEALGSVSKLSAAELPVIPRMPNARESWRRMVALHRELSRRSTKTNKTYFLGCRDAAKVFPGLSHQTAYNINLALAQIGVIKIVRVGDPRPNGRASEFRYLLPQTENGVPQPHSARATAETEKRT